MDYVQLIQLHLPSILEKIHQNILDDETIYQFVSQDEIQELLNRQEQLIKEYLLTFKIEKIDEKICYNFYKDLNIPYALVVKSLNFIKTELIRRLSNDLDKNDLIDFGIYFQHFINIAAKVYLKKEVMDFKHKRPINEYYLLEAHDTFIKQIVDAVQHDDMERFPKAQADNCTFTYYMEYLESLMVCMDINLCNYLHDLHKMLHNMANSFYLFYKKGSFAESYLIFKDLKELILKFENVINELYFVTFSDLEGSFFRFIQLYQPQTTEYLTLIDIKKLKSLNQIYGEEDVTKAIHIIEERLKQFFKDKRKNLLIRGITADFYIYSLDRTSQEYKDEIKAIQKLIKEPITIDNKTIEFDALIVGLEIEEYFELTPQEVIKILHFLKKEAKTKGLALYLALEDHHKAKLKSYLEDRYDFEFIKTKLDSEALTLVFQPIVTVKEQKLYAVEALARLEDNGALIPAGMVIDKVFEADLIDRFDTLVLQKLLKLKESLKEATPRVFVNISARSLINQTVLSILDELLATLEVGVILEITEQAMVGNIELLRSIHQKHKAYFAADDFGTGYTSIKSVTDMAKEKILQVLKIDGTLIKNIHTDNFDQKTVSVIAHLAKEFDLESVAEFVENQECLELLTKNGITLAQGYYIQKPSLLDEITIAFMDKKA